MKILQLLLFTMFSGLLGAQTDVMPVTSAVTIDGELKKWHKVTLTFEGPTSSENNTYNPFLHYRLDVTFSSGNKKYCVPGYFAADGNAKETSATEGNKWRVHFTPDEVGVWDYNVSFIKGSNIATNSNTSSGVSAEYMDGKKGQLNIAPSDKSGNDLRAKGRLQYVGGPYLRFAETGEYFLKAGADAPENLLAYADFDGGYKTDGIKDELIKKWEPHVNDWKAGDPTWQNGKGKGLIGAINYLASKGMNAFSFLPMNIAGDDRNVFPYISYENYERIDVSKLDQWEVIFEHADKLGMFLHFKTSEVENQGLLDGGDLGIQRKLYYRELIARFGHHLALNWNIGEENGRWEKNHKTPWQTTSQRLACAQYFYNNDPYHHLVVIHNGQQFYDLLGPESKYTGLSIQTTLEDFGNVHSTVLKWKRLAKESDKKWALAVDEPGDHRYALTPDKVNPTHDNARQNALWGAFMAGAWGIEWYFGYEHEHSDLTCEDWRTRNNMWEQSKYLLDFFTKNEIPYWEMEPSDEATLNNDYVLAKENVCYVIYMKMGSKSKTVLSDLNGSFNLRWFNPRNGTFVKGSQRMMADSNLIIPVPPSDQNKDWVALLSKI